MKFLIANFLNSSGQYVRAIRVRTLSLKLYTLSPTSSAHSITSDDHTVKRSDCKSTVNSPVQLRRNSAKRCEQKKNSEGAALHYPNAWNRLET